MAKIKKSIDLHDSAFILLCIICTFLVLLSFRYLTFASGADEGYYLRYATQVSNNGISTFPRLFKEYISAKENWVFPNPLRIGYITISALCMKVLGSTYLTLSSLSLLSYILALGISYYFCRKYFGRAAALAFSVLLAFSPLNMAMARRALLDGPANLFLVTCAWFFFDLLKDRKAFKYPLFTILYSSAILMKETSVLLIPVFLAYMIISKYGLKRKISARDLLSTCLYPPLLAGFAYLAASGSLSHVMSVIKIILASPSTNKYAMLYSSGPWFRYIVDFMLLSPWTLLLAVGFLFSFAASEKPREEILYFSTFLLIYFCILVFFAKNVRYAMILDTSIKLFSVLMISKIMENMFGRYARTLTWLAVIAIAVYDYLSFYVFFVAYGIYDPVSIGMLKVRHFIPFM